MNEHEVCAALFFFFSAQETSPPTFTACGLVSGESIGLCFSCCLSPLLAVLSEFAALPLVPALEAQNRMGRWRSRGNYGKGTGLAPEHQHPDCPSPALPRCPPPPSSLGVSGRARLGEGGWVNIFKCLRYVLDIFSFKLER